MSLDGSDWQATGLVPGISWWHRVGRSNESEPPSTTGWIPATVPGHVVADAVAAGLVPDPYIGLNSLAAEWVAQRDWVYRRGVTLPPGFLDGGRRAVLHFEGVDDTCRVFLNGAAVGANQGMNRAFECDVTEHLHNGENQLTVVVDEAPFEPQIQPQLGSTVAVRTWKARFPYGWGFSPRLVSTGIWDSVWIEARPTAWLRDCWTRPLRTGDRWQLEVLCDIDGRGDGLVLEVAIRDGDRVVAESTSDVEPGPHRRTVDAPGVATWQVNGAGAQPLYRTELRLRDGDGHLLHDESLPVGFRTVTFQRTPGAGEDALPYQVVVNGEPIFIRGWNWVSVDQLYGVLREDRYRNLIEHAKAAGCNLLRVWGGAHLERRLFYDLCDEAGILVWQEFIQSSSGHDSEPATDDEYLAYIRGQAEAMVVRRRMHPCLAIWCGGNELAVHPERTPLPMSHPALALLGEVVAQLDPDRLFLPTSSSGPRFDLIREGGPPGHDVHGPWHFTGDGDYHALHNRFRMMLYSEFGANGAADADLINHYLGGASWPPDISNPTWVHHGGIWRNDVDIVRTLFGDLDTLDDYVRGSQWIHAHALGYAVESQRRREDECAGVMPWMFLEPWPNATCTNVIQYAGRAKPGYWATARAFAPTLISAAFRSIRWDPGEMFDAAVWLSGPAPAGSTARWWCRDIATGARFAEGEATFAGDVRGPRRIGTCTAPVPSDTAAWVLEMEVLDAAAVAVATNQYVFSNVATAPLAPLLHVAPGTLSVEITASGDVSVEAAGAPLIGMRAFAIDDRAGPGVRTGHVQVLFPGRSLRLGVQPGRTVCISAWNAPDVVVTTAGASLAGATS